MSSQTIESFQAKKCRPCEGGVEKLTSEEASEDLRSLSGWRISQEGHRLEKEWLMKSFKAGIDFINRVAAVAEEEGHHPEIHRATIPARSARSARARLGHRFSLLGQPRRVVPHRIVRSHGLHRHFHLD